jgi:hypothetical protein
MKPGEYIGQDGRTYRWDKWNGAYQLYNESHGIAMLHPADWPAAKAALDALIEDEAGEWVELFPHDRSHPYIRISTDGGRVEEMVAGEWVAYDAWWIRAAYRAGLEQVQELVEAVDAVGDDIITIYGWAAIKAAAKKVKR